jgi:hypothetical protein
MPDLREFVFTKYTRKGRVEDRAIGRRRRTELVIPGTPPSFNVTAQAHWTKHRKAKREWQNWLGIALMSAAVPRNLLCVEATASLVFKQNRRRDEGNFRVILEKALATVWWRAVGSPTTPLIATRLDGSSCESTCSKPL